jgi:hypothetical protein
LIIADLIILPFGIAMLSSFKFIINL